MLGSTDQSTIYRWQSPLSKIKSEPAGRPRAYRAALHPGLPDDGNPSFLGNTRCDMNLLGDVDAHWRCARGRVHIQRRPTPVTIP